MTYFWDISDYIAKRTKNLNNEYNNDPAWRKRKKRNPDAVNLAENAVELEARGKGKRKWTHQRRKPTPKKKTKKQNIVLVMVIVTPTWEAQQKKTTRPSPTNRKHTIDLKTKRKTQAQITQTTDHQTWPNLLETTENQRIHWTRTRTKRPYRHQEWRGPGEWRQRQQPTYQKPQEPRQKTKGLRSPPPRGPNQNQKKPARPTPWKNETTGRSNQNKNDLEAKNTRIQRMKQNRGKANTEKQQIN